MIAQTSKVALLAFACFAVATADAGAYDCTSSQSKTIDEGWTDYKAEIRTVVENRTSDKSWDVTIYRNGNEKDKEVLDNTNRYMRFTMNVGDATKAEEVFVKVSFSPLSGKAKAFNCEYKVRYNTGNDTATWSLLDNADGICEDLTGCDDCSMTCQNKYINGADRWTTTLAICDFFDKNCSAGAR